MERSGSVGRAAERGTRWAYRLAWVLWAVTFPLIWMGGFVTTYNAGMAVPDWPNTYGYNLFLYPIESWLKTWDIFLEHSHRLIASAAGFVSIALMVILWRTGSTLLRRLGVVVFILVCVQGIIGGLRVLGQELLLANLHGCVAPLFFGLVTGVVVVTGHAIAGPDQSKGLGEWSLFRGGAAWRFLLVMIIYTQIVIGAQLRHLPPTLSPQWAFFWTIVHLIFAGLIGVALGIVWWREWREHLSKLLWLKILGAIYAVQLTLGLFTWVVNYNFPIWFLNYFLAISYTVVQGGAAQALVTTAHTATGSLLLAAGVACWLTAGLDGSPQNVRVPSPG